MSLNPLQAGAFSLAGAGSSIGDTVLNLKSFKDINGVNIAMSDLGTIAYLTIEPGNGSNEEQVSFTGVTQNSDGSAQLSGIKSVLFKSPYTESSGFAKTHAGSTTAVLSNTAGFYNQFAILANNETVTGQWTFTNTPIVPGTVSDASTTVKGVSKLSVAPVSPTNPIAVGTNDPRLPSADPTTLFAPLSYVPTGVVFPYSASTTPTGFLPCDGAPVSRAVNAVLFGVIGTTYGSGNGSTTFNVPDLRGRSIIGKGTGTKVATISSITGNVITVTGLSNITNNEYQTAQSVVFTATVPGNLSNGATYFIIKVSNTTFSVASSGTNARAGTAITLAGTETGFFTLTLTTRTLADTGGVEQQALLISQMPAHTHSTEYWTSPGGVTFHPQGGSLTSDNSAISTTSTGGDGAHDNMMPFLTLNFIIKT